MLAFQPMRTSAAPRCRRGSIITAAVGKSCLIPTTFWPKIARAPGQACANESLALSSAFSGFHTHSYSRAMHDVHLAQGAIVADEQKDLAYYLLKAQEYRWKAEGVSDPGPKAALEKIARDYMVKARELDPALPLSGELSPQTSRSSAAATKGPNEPRPKERTATRKRVFRTAFIEIGGGTLDCVVRNLSETGAAIEVLTPLYIPDRFTLSIPSEQIKRQCHVVWRKGRRFGIAFY
jgi:PilZ domain